MAGRGGEGASLPAHPLHLSACRLSQCSKTCPLRRGLKVLDQLLSCLPTETPEQQPPRAPHSCMDLFICSPGIPRPPTATQLTHRAEAVTHLGPGDLRCFPGGFPGRPGTWPQPGACWPAQQALWLSWACCACSCGQAPRARSLGSPGRRFRRWSCWAAFWGSGKGPWGWLLAWCPSGLQLGMGRPQALPRVRCCRLRCLLPGVQ